MMGGVQPVARTRTGEVVWYLSGSVGAVEAHLYADASGGVVLRGETGLQVAARLRQQGWTGRLWLDPAVYERPGNASDHTLFGDRWAVAQAELRVTEVISPGAYVAESDREGLDRAIEDQRSWLGQVGQGRLSLALHSRWLSSDVGYLIQRLRDLAEPLAIALADPNDPLGHAGAVAGYVELIHGVPGLMLLRGDLGAVGGVANGAEHGAIGTSTTVRHAVPPGKRGGGVPGDRTPSIFLRDTLAFRLGSFLDQLPRNAVPSCDLACCLGARLSRFNDERLAAEARLHNRLTVQSVIDEVLRRAPTARPNAFRSMCEEAVVATEALSSAARRVIAPSPQLIAWAGLRPR
jgi:hypothetical protein